MNENMTTLWARLGISMELLPTEMNALACGSKAEKENTLARVFSQGRAKICGDSYVPGNMIGEYNMKYGTDYSRFELDLETDALDGKVLRTDDEKAPPQKNRNRGDAR